jgi:transcription initiation factor IIE alpha subunit
MANSITKKILDVKLIKVEKSYRNDIIPTYYYYFTLEEIEEPLLVQVNAPIKEVLIGKTITYYINADFEVSEFNII